MAEVEDRDNSHQTRMDNLPRDLLKRFIASSHRHNHRFPLPLPVARTNHAEAVEGGGGGEGGGEEEKEKEEELELSLGLSMNGRFGVDPSAKKIKRTTSIPEFVNHEEIGYVVPVVATGSLIRTCSLPTEIEEQWRKRKELQTIRRMEARKKRSEKQKNLKAMREKNLVVVASEEQGGGGGDGGGLRRTTSLTTRVGGLGLNCEKEKGGSSSESDGQQHGGGQGTTPMDTSSPIATNLLSDEQKSPVTGAGAGVGARVAESSGKVAAVTMRSLSSQHSAPQDRTKEMVRNLLEDMPSVSTKGEGPNGKRIEGFLYRYGKGEEVRILCVCHGSFLTPAEFVKHAGGDDVANPLQLIKVVSPSFL